MSFSVEAAESNYCTSLGKLVNMTSVRIDMNLYLELADLCVKGEGVKEHGADESDVRRLAGKNIFKIQRWFYREKPPVIDPLPPVNPESGQL